MWREQRMAGAGWTTIRPGAWPEAGVRLVAVSNPTESSQPRRRRRRCLQASTASISCATIVVVVVFVGGGGVTVAVAVGFAALAAVLVAAAVAGTGVYDGASDGCGVDDWAGLDACVSRRHRGAGEAPPPSPAPALDDEVGDWLRTRQTCFRNCSSEMLQDEDGDWCRLALRRRHAQLKKKTSCAFTGA